MHALISVASRLMVMNFGQVLAQGEPNAVMHCYKLGRLKRSADIVFVFDGSMSPLQGISQYSNYNGAPYYRPRQNTPVADLHLAQLGFSSGMTNIPLPGA